jgi:hypothetical protein
MKSKRILLSALVLVLLLTACSAVSGLTAANHSANAFMQALKDQKADTSWSMLSPDLQTEIGDQAAWADFASIRNFDSWKFTSSNVSGDRAQVDGDATLGQDKYTISLVMDASGDNWLVSGIDIKAK